MTDQETTVATEQPETSSPEPSKPEAQPAPAPAKKEYVSLRELLEAGVHLGHRTKRWNPKMREYIYGSRNGIHIVDLRQTLELFNKACDVVTNLVARGGQVLFIGTKRQATDIIKQEAARCKMHSATNRWLGGTLTNFATIKGTIDRMHAIEAMRSDGTYERLVKKECLKLDKEHARLDKFVGGIREMSTLPAAVFIVDPNKEAIAVAETVKLGITLIALTDTNCNPDPVDIPIPGNDDAIRSIKLVTSRLADACLEGVKRRREMGKFAGVEGAVSGAPGPKVQVARRPRAGGGKPGKANGHAQQ